jgi:hypothetical protein
MVETKVPVSERALVQRLNRHLSKEGQVLKKLRGERWRGDLGDYYIVDEHRNIVAASHVNPVALAQEIGVLAAWETVREAGEPSAPAPPGVSLRHLTHGPETPARSPQKKRKDAIAPQVLEAIAHERRRCPSLSWRQFAQHLFDTGIYRSQGQNGIAVPVSLGALHRWIQEAKDAGMF